MKRFNAKVVLELAGGGIAMTGATITAVSSNWERSWIGIFVGVGCILLGWAAFTISQIEENEK
jgi:hypothetical protein